MKVSKVFCYYENLPDQDAVPMLGVWADSWRLYGWEPHILGLEDAKKHPRYQEFVDRVSQLPTENKKSYELACYVRHLAYSMVAGEEGVLFVDWDVLNLGFYPFSPLSNLQFLDWWKVPCAFFANKSGVESLIERFMAYVPPPDCVHTSDMHICGTLPLLVTPMCAELRYWPSNLVHFNWHSCGGGFRKAEYISRVPLLNRIRHTKNRESLHLIAKEFFKFPSMIEVGVYSGGFAKFNLDTLSFHYYDGVDSFQPFNSYGDPMQEANWKAVEEEAIRVFATAGDHAQTVRQLHTGYAEEVAGTIPDESYDIVFLDANHAYTETSKMLPILWRKVKRGGMLCVHDYLLPRVAREENHWCEGVFYAVNDFIASEKINRALCHSWECSTMVIVKL
jgi:Methyltransferase domain